MVQKKGGLPGQKVKLVHKGPLPVIRARSDEVESLFALFAIQQELETAESRMEKRIRAIPNALRDIRMVRSVMDKLCANLIGTFPPEKCESILKNVSHMAYEVRFNKFIGSKPDPAWAMISIKDLDAIAKRAHSYHCFACDKKCSACELGKAFDHIMIQSRRRDESWEDIDFNLEHADGEVVTDEGNDLL